MPGTAINAIDYSNDDTASLIEEALNETEPQQQRQQAPPQQQQEPQQQYQAPPPQYQQQGPPQYQQEQYQQGPPQYQQGPPQYQQGPPSHYQENFDQPQQSSFSLSLPDSLKKTIMLFAILLLLNNSSFKNVLAKIPMTVNIEGEHTFLMTLVVCVIIAIVYFLASQVF